MSAYVLMLPVFAPGGRVFLRRGHAEAPPHAPEGAEVPALGQGQGRKELHDVLPGMY